MGTLFLMFVVSLSNFHTGSIYYQHAGHSGFWSILRIHDCSTRVSETDLRGSGSWFVVRGSWLIARGSFSSSWTNKILQHGSV